MITCELHQWEDTDCPYCEHEEGIDEKPKEKSTFHTMFDGIMEGMTATNLRTFQTGATRSPLTDKLQYEGFISPVVLKRYAEYMHKHRIQSDGSIRDADNWQKGIPDSSAIDSMLRHVMDVWLHQRKFESEMTDSKLDALCAIIFNVSIMILNMERNDANRT